MTITCGSCDTKPGQHGVRARPAAAGRGAHRDRYIIYTALAETMHYLHLNFYKKMRTTRPRLQQHAVGSWHQQQGRETDSALAGIAPAAVAGILASQGRPRGPSTTMQLLLSLVLLLLTTASDANSSALSAPTAPALTPSPQFSVTVDGEAAFVYLATTDGSRVHNGSFVHISLHPGASREVVVTLLEPDPEGPPKRGALRPDPIPIDDHETRDDPRAGLPPVKIAGTTASFQVATPMHAVLELDTEYELSSFSSGLMIFAEFVDTNAPDPSVRPAANALQHPPA
jgi:hypothetical protein